MSMVTPTPEQQKRFQDEVAKIQKRTGITRVQRTNLIQAARQKFLGVTARPLPKSVTDKAKRQSENIRQLEKNLRAQRANLGKGVTNPNVLEQQRAKITETQRQLEQQREIRAQILKTETQKLEERFEFERQQRLRTAREAARAAGIKEAEARALGEVVGTVQPDQTVLVGAAAAEARRLREQGITVDPLTKGGRALGVEVQETLKATDEVTAQKLNQLGGIDVKVNLSDVVGVGEGISAKVTRPARPEDFDVARGQLFFPTPQALALGVPAAFPKEEKIVKKEIRVKAGEQPTPEQLKGATAIIQEGLGGMVETRPVQPITNLIQGITTRISDFAREQEQIAKTSENVIEKGLAEIGARAGRLGEKVFPVTPVGVTLTAASAVEQGAVKTGIETGLASLGEIAERETKIARTSKDPTERGLANVSAFGAGIGEQLLGDVAFGLNISRQITGEQLRAQITDTPFDIGRAVTTELPAGQAIRVPETLVNVAVAEGITAIPRAAGFLQFGGPTGVSIDLSRLQAGFGPAAESIGKIIEQQGLARGLGSVVGIVLPFSPKAITPFRVLPITQTTGRIIRTVEPTIIGGRQLGKITIGGVKGVKIVETPELTQLGKTLVFGKGGERSIPLLSKTAVEGFVRGSPLRAQKSIEKFVSEASPIGRGFEFATEKPFVAKILTAEKVLSEKVAQGKLLPAQKEIPKRARELIKLIQKTPEIPQQQFAKATEALTEAVTAGKESEALAKIIKGLPKEIKGGFAQSFLVIGKRARKDIDIDFGGLFRGEKRAIKAAEKAQIELTLASRETGRKFTVKFTEGGPKLISSGGKLGSGEKKVIEFLTKREGVDAAQLDSISKDLGQVFGFKLQRGAVNVKLPFEQQGKVDKLQGQFGKKLASILSEQGPEVESAISQGRPVQFLKEGFKDLAKTEKGFRIGPPDFRLKDLVDLFGEGQIVETFAAVSRQKGKVQLADDLIRLNTKFKKLFPEVDFKAVSGQADIIEFGNIAKSDVGSVAALRATAKTLKETFPAAVPSGIGQVGKGTIGTARGQTLSDDVGTNVNLKEGSRQSKDTLQKFKDITSPNQRVVAESLRDIANKPTGLIRLLTPKQSIKKFNTLDLDAIAFVPASEPASVINLNLAKFVKEFPLQKAVAREIIPIINHENLHNVLRKIDEGEIKQGFLIKRTREPARELDNLRDLPEKIGPKGVQREFQALANADLSPAALKQFKTDIKPILQDILVLDLARTEASIADAAALRKSIGGSVQNSIGRTFTKDELKALSISGANIEKARQKNQQERISASTKDTRQTDAASQIGKVSLADELPSFGSPSLLRNLEKLGSVPSSSPRTERSLSLPELTPISIAKPPSPSDSIPTGAIPPIKVPSTGVPPSPPSPPSPPRPVVPPRPPVRPPFALRGIILPTTRSKVPVLPKIPTGLLIRLGIKEERRKRVLPTFTKALTFIADPADPLRAGVFATKGVGQLVSGRATIFKTIDLQLAKARQSIDAIIPLGERIGVERARIGLGQRPKRKKISKKEKAKRKAAKQQTQRRGLV